MIENNNNVRNISIGDTTARNIINFIDYCIRYELNENSNMGIEGRRLCNILIIKLAIKKAASKSFKKKMERELKRK